MPAIDWNKFGVTGVSKQDSFEELCLHLFCRKHRLSEGVSGDFNQAGLETEPVKVGKKTYGFQSKYFDNSVDYSQIKKSVITALQNTEARLMRYVYSLILKLNQTSQRAARKLLRKLQNMASQYNGILAVNLK